MRRDIPPRFARWLLRLQPLGERRQEVEADLVELFQTRVDRRGIHYARRRFYGDVFSLWRTTVSTMPEVGRAAAPGDSTLGTAGRTLSYAREVARDLSYAARLLRRTPATAALTVAGLALAIGVCTTVFSIMNAVAFVPTGITDPGSIMRVMRAQPDGLGTNWAFLEYAALHDAADGARVEAMHREGVRFSTTADAEASDVTGVMFVSGGLLPMLTARASAGRLLGPSDDVIGAPPVVVVGHRFWMTRLAGDPSVVGRQIWLSGAPVTVVGIAERRFTGTIDTPPAFWIPLSTYHLIYGGEPFTNTSRRGVTVVARVPPRSSPAQAETELSAAARGLPLVPGPEVKPATGVRLQPYTSLDRRRGIGLILAIVGTVIGLVLLLACVNVANLLLASAISRRQEIGVRRAIGASRARIVRQLLTESLSLGLIAGGLGLMLTVWLVPVLLTFIRAPETVDAAPDLRVYVFLTVISTAAGLGAGLLPARRAAGDDLTTPLKGASAGIGGAAAPARFRSVLVGVQATASIVLLVLAALLTRAMIRSTQIELGFDADRLIAVTPGMGRDARSGLASSTAYWDQVLERVRAVPGVRAASLAYASPFGNSSKVTIMQRGGSRYTIVHNDVKADYLETIGLRMLRGRGFTEADERGAAKVAIISETVARDFFEGRDPIGQSLEAVNGDRNTMVIGVAPDAITARLRDARGAMIYEPMKSLAPARLVIRTHGPPDMLMRSVRSALEPIERGVHYTITPVREGLENQRAEARILASLAGSLALLALALAVVGLYGVTAFVVGQRTQEIGVRMALGASRADVVRLLVTDSLRPVVIGLGAGVFVALLGGRVMSGALYGISATDPIAFAGAVSVLLVAATLAVILPTRHAAGMDPAATLRRL